MWHCYFHLGKRCEYFFHHFHSLKYQNHNHKIVLLLQPYLSESIKLKPKLLALILQTVDLEWGNKIFLFKLVF